jgi:hypothetical protein
MTQRPMMKKFVSAAVAGLLAGGAMTACNSGGNQAPAKNDKPTATSTGTSPADNKATDNKATGGDNKAGAGPAADPSKTPAAAAGGANKCGGGPNGCPNGCPNKNAETGKDAAAPVAAPGADAAKTPAAAGDGAHKCGGGANGCPNGCPGKAAAPVAAPVAGDADATSAPVPAPK